jgi:hypothetical protein
VNHQIDAMENVIFSSLPSAITVVLNVHETDLYDVSSDNLIIFCCIRQSRPNRELLVVIAGRIVQLIDSMIIVS